MYLFIETIRIYQKKVENLHYHQQRLAKVFQDFFPETQPFILKDCLKIPENLSEGVYKSRFLYNEKAFTVEFLPYSKRFFQKVLLVEAGDFCYSYKFSERSFLQAASNNAQEKGFEEVIFTKEGFLTDSSYCNIALKAGKKWFTPEKSLLAGTMRQYLLEREVIFPLKIHQKDLQNFAKIRFFNALMPWEDCIEVPINQVVTL